MMAIPMRWAAMGVFILSLSLSFLDRQLLAAVAPMLRAEFGLTNAEYGQLVGAFFLVYALAAPGMGWMVDRFGMRVGAAVAVTVWSVAGMATGFANSFRGLMACRMGLGLGESAAIPLIGKGSGIYLDSAERGLAGGFGALGITAGSMAAPLLVGAMGVTYGWRAVFVAAGALGLLWVPVWWWTAGRAPAAPFEAGPAGAADVGARELLRDRRLWAVMLAYCLVYTPFMLWANWTTIYFVQERHLTMAEANLQFAWFPPVFSIVGGFLGGGLAFRRIRRGSAAAPARMWVSWASTPLLVAGAMIPVLESNVMAAVAIGLVYLSFQSMLSNVSILPVDLFGAGPAGLSNSFLATVAAGAQVVVAPLIGAAVDAGGFGMLCVGMSVLPVIGLGVLQAVLNREGRRAVPAAA